MKQGLWRLKKYPAPDYAWFPRAWLLRLNSRRKASEDACATHSRIFPLADRSRRGCGRRKHCRFCRRLARICVRGSKTLGKLLVPECKGDPNFLKQFVELYAARF